MYGEDDIIGQLLQQFGGMGGANMLANPPATGFLGMMAGQAPGMGVIDKPGGGKRGGRGGSGGGPGGGNPGAKTGMLLAQGYGDIADPTLSDATGMLPPDPPVMHQQNPWAAEVTEGEGYPADIEEQLGTVNRFGDEEYAARADALSAVMPEVGEVMGDFANSDMGAAAGDLLIKDPSPETEEQVRQMFQQWKNAWDVAGGLEQGLEEVDQAAGRQRVYKRGGSSQWK